MLFGLIPDNIATAPVEEANQAVTQALQRINPLLRDVENRAGGILHGLLDRLNGTKIELTITIPSEPKAVPVDNSDQS